MGRKRHHEEHANHEAWAIPYGDLVTLLLAFFVVMYAISSVNGGKYRVLSESLTAAFNGAPRSVDPVQVGIRTAGGRDAIDTGSLSRTALAGADSSALARIPLPSAGAARAGDTSLSAEQAAALERTAAEQDARREQLAVLADEVESAMAQMISDGQLVVRRSGDWLEIDIRADTLFGSGSAALGQAATDAIERLADVLRIGSNQIRVEGHTDNVPIRTTAFPSNWELSSARAAGVVRILAGRGVDPVRLSVLGLGEHRPRDTNETAVGRLANRRVLLIIQPAAAAAPTDGDLPQSSNPTIAAALN
jgi:chemotaxis protein MotB